MGQRAHDETSSEPCGCRRGRGDLQASQVALVLKNLTANAGDIRDLGSIPGLERSHGVGNGNPLQHFCLEYSVDRGAWGAKIHGVQLDETE